MVKSYKLSSKKLGFVAFDPNNIYGGYTPGVVAYLGFQAGLSEDYMRPDEHDDRVTSKACAKISKLYGISIPRLHWWEFRSSYLSTLDQKQRSYRMKGVFEKFVRRTRVISEGRVEEGVEITST